MKREYRYKKKEKEETNNKMGEEREMLKKEIGQMGQRNWRGK